MLSVILLVKEIAEKVAEWGAFWEIGEIRAVCTTGNSLGGGDINDHGRYGFGQIGKAIRVRKGCGGGGGKAEYQRDEPCDKVFIGVRKCSHNVYPFKFDMCVFVFNELLVFRFFMRENQGENTHGFSKPCDLVVSY